MTPANLNFTSILMKTDENDRQTVQICEEKPLSTQGSDIQPHNYSHRLDS